MNFFLKTRSQIDEACKFIEDNGLVSSGISAKNWEVWQVMPYMVDGAWLDMGSDGGVVLDNLVAKKIKGYKAGIDLSYTSNSFDFEKGIDYHKGDLMNTPFAPETFDFVVSLSVIEHEVDFSKFAKEVSRILKIGGHLFVSFDFWEPKPLYEKRKLYKLDWNILDKTDVISLIAALDRFDIELTSDIDWTTKDAVINDTYCSPVAGVSYTFGILHFIKK